MAIHKIVKSDNEYVHVDLANNCGSWSWREVDNYGMYIGTTSAQFKTKEDAKKDALDTLGGDHFI